LRFLGVGQRRGAHVSVPKIGSRGAHLCFGGIWGVYAELRREFNWRNWDLVFFEGLTVVPRGAIEEGGRFVFPPVLLGEFMCVGVLGLHGIGREAMGRGVGGHFGGI
jgi:hypothetical protein